MARTGLIGPSYASQSLNADAQVCMNWYYETIESGTGKTSAALYPTPGTKSFAAIPGNSVRQQIYINGRMFAIVDAQLFEVFANGTFAARGAVQNDGLTAYMVASPQQVLIASAGETYVLTLATNALSTIGSVVTFGGPVQQVDFMDGFFIALLKNSQTFFLSNLFDATNWTPLGVTQKIIVSVFPGNVLAMKVNQRRLLMQGVNASVFYYTSGSSQVFDVDPSGTIENGIFAAASTSKLDNSLFWLDGDERGAGVVRRLSGYTPVRVSNHAIEFAIQNYATFSDAVGYSYQDQGHSFYVLTFPTAQATWVYDVATNMWHQRGFWNAAGGFFQAHKGWNHVYAFGKHLVGDFSSGNIYQMAIPMPAGGGWAFADDNGKPLRRLRRAPHISTEQKWIFHNSLQIDVETGLGPEPPLQDGAGKARDPQMLLRWSDDGGHTWSNGRLLNCGQAGRYKTRALTHRLGRSRDRVYEISVEDAIPWRLISDYLEAEPGFEKQERLAKTYLKAT